MCPRHHRHDADFHLLTLGRVNVAGWLGPSGCTKTAAQTTSDAKNKILQRRREGHTFYAMYVASLGACQLQKRHSPLQEVMGEMGVAGVARLVGMVEVGPAGALHLEVKRRLMDLSF